MRIPLLSRKTAESPVSGNRQSIRSDKDSSISFQKPTNRIKVPTKTWGRRDRLVVVGILLLTLLFAIVSWYSSTGTEFSFGSLDNLVPSETVTFEKEK